MSASTMQPNLDQLAGLTGVRAGALSRWQETGWPNSRVEQWRFTRLASLEKMDLRPASVAAAAGSRRPFRLTCRKMPSSCRLAMAFWTLPVLPLCPMA